MSGTEKEVQREENEEKYIRNNTKKKGISEVLVVQIATGFHWAVPDQDLWLGGHYAYAVPIISVGSVTFHTSGVQDKSTFVHGYFATVDSTDSSKEEDSAIKTA